MTSSVWFIHPMELLDMNKLHQFYPQNSMTFNEKLNSFMRFTVYFSVVVYLLNKNKKVFYTVFFGGVLTVILYNYKKEIFKIDTENFEDTNGTECTKPVENNPFMNVLMSEYTEDPERGEACDTNEPKIKDKMQKYFYNDLFRSVDEVFDNKYSYRQFYTTPNTAIPNDQEGFAKWLYYNEEKTLKEQHF